MVDRRESVSNPKPRIFSSSGRYQSIPSYAKPFFFAVFDSLVAVRTHPGAQKSMSGDFRADNDDRRTNRLLYPLLRMRARVVMTLLKRFVS